jgi:hypothetical protein
MTFVSMAQASRHLGIDAKTVRRWLAEAQLPLHRHPGDARKKGISREHLEVLARLHQRSLPLLPQPSPAPVPDAPPTLPDALLALPEQILALQAQITALQEQIAALTRLLEQHGQEPVPPAPPAQPGRTALRPKNLAPSASRSSRPAKTPAKPTHVLPRVEYSEQGRYVVICPKRGVLPFEPDTPEWFAWVKEQTSFRFVGKGGHFSAHHEWRVPKGAWRAHRQIRNHTSIVRLAPNQDLTIAVLEQAAQALQAHLH